jgi:hypothetical protein
MSIRDTLLGGPLGLALRLWATCFATFPTKKRPRRLMPPGSKARVISIRRHSMARVLPRLVWVRHWPNPSGTSNRLDSSASLLWRSCLGNSGT